MRKYHQKTRTGCVQCKKRRIKCDETKPSCLNCTRRAVDCSLTFLTPSAPKTRYQFQFRDRVTAATNNNALNATRVLSSPSKTPGLSLVPANVELFQHYTTVGHRALSTQVRGPELWEFLVPRIALQFPFLMHGMLALCALHLATLQPNRRRELVRRATENEFQALPSYRQIMGTPNNDNIHAIFVFSGFVAQYSLAASHSLEGIDGKTRIENETVDDLPEFPPNWFHIIRGTSTMIYQNYELLIRGPFGKVLVLQPNDIPFEINPDDKYLKPLEELFLPVVYSPSQWSIQQNSPTSTSSSSPEVVDISVSIDKVQSRREAELQVYAKTLYSLRRTFVLRFSPCGTIDDMAACIIWPGIVESTSQLFSSLPSISFIHKFTFIHITQNPEISLKHLNQSQLHTKLKTPSPTSINLKYLSSLQKPTSASSRSGNQKLSSYLRTTVFSLTTSITVGIFAAWERGGSLPFGGVFHWSGGDGFLGLSLLLVLLWTLLWTLMMATLREMAEMREMAKMAEMTEMTEVAEVIGKWKNWCKNGLILLGRWYDVEGHGGGKLYGRYLRVRGKENHLWEKGEEGREPAYSG